MNRPIDWVDEALQWFRPAALKRFENYVEVLHEKERARWRKSGEIGQLLNADEAREMLLVYQDSIVAELSHFLRTRHTAEWIYLYRRLELQKMIIDADSENRNAFFVDRNVELAFSKYGKKDAKFRPRFTGELSPREWFGGALEKIVTASARNGISIQAVVSSIRAANLWILKDVDHRDLANVLRCVLLCRLYFETGVKIRQLANATGAIISEDYELNVLLDGDDRELTDWYDARSVQHESWTAAIGILYEDIEEEPDAAFLPMITLNRGKRTFDDMNVATVAYRGDHAPPYMGGPMQMAGMARQVAFLDEEFKQRNGFGVSDLLVALAGVTVIALRPPSAVVGHASREDILKASHERFLTRGFQLVRCCIEDIVTVARDYRDLHATELTGTSDVGMDNAVRSLVLSDVSAEHIQLWSGGRWFPLVPVEHGFLINLVGIPSMLYRIFFGVKDESGTKGPIFERTFRRALEKENVEVIAGELTFADGSKREVDAAVPINDTLLIFECRAMQRRLNYNRGHPRTLRERSSDLYGKIKQARSLADRLSTEPSGRNYDFSSIMSFKAFVVSPFVEYIPDKSDNYIEDGWPRILSFSEAMKLVRCYKAGVFRGDGPQSTSTNPPG